jgi:hypothetical protein
MYTTLSCTFSLRKPFKVEVFKKHTPKMQSNGRKLKEGKYLCSLLICDLYFVARKSRTRTVAQVCDWK